MSNQNELFGLLWAWLSMAVGGGVLFGGIWLLGVQPPRRLFGPQRFRAVPWRGVDVILLFLVTFLFLGSLHPVIAFPLQLVTIFFVLHFGTGTRPYQLGLTTHRLGENLCLGYLTWLILTPPVYGVNVLVSLFHIWMHRPLPKEHPLLEQLHHHPSALDWLLGFLTAAVIAPISEELLFRGVLQRWVTRRRWGADAALIGAFCLALLLGGEKISKAIPLGEDPERFWTAVEGFAPALFILAMIPGYTLADWLLWTWLPHPGAGRTVYAVSLVWAAAHSHVWPSPIPLFFLGLGLGCLAYRTQSLVSSITAHVLFNAMTLLSFLWT